MWVNAGAGPRPVVLVVVVPVARPVDGEKVAPSVLDHAEVVSVSGVTTVVVDGAVRRRVATYRVWPSGWSDVAQPVLFLVPLETVALGSNPSLGVIHVRMLYW